ncbi:MAG: Competence-damaged protein [Gemmatimonadetes bacterium]|nr:Competence-damaged protein [Gemmatimonadota bacterium]
MEVELVTIGDELLLGFTIDTNAAHLARQLADAGITIRRRATVGDTAGEIVDAVQAALDRTGAVITTGGLGPTSDDLTKPSIARIFGREMFLDEEHVGWMQERWRARFGREMPESNRNQAMLPRGARKLQNNHGSAPGIWLEDERGRWVAMLPGVPREMRGMLADTLLPLVRERAGTGGRVVRSLTLRTTGIAESMLADMIGDRLMNWPSLSLAYLPGIDGVDLRVTIRDAESQVADEQLSTATDALRKAVGAGIYGTESEDMPEIVLALCRSRHETIAVAESCTGGLLGARLTTPAGSSDVFLGGVIAYSNTVKEQQLGASASDIEQHGAVSEPVVRQMAMGVRALMGASIGIGITGIAGPGGGSEEKPVGTVWIGVDFGGVVEARLARLWGNREEVRYRAAQLAMEIVRRRLSA